MTGDVVSIGKCGQNVNFVLYSDGRLLLKGTGATFDYSTDSNPSPFQNNSNIKSVIVSEGVTGIGERLFQYCDNLKTVSLPTTLTAIKRAAFLPHIDGYIYHQTLNGLTELKIPERVTELGVNAFAGTAIKSVTVPSSVTTVCAMVFSECQYLETVRYEGKDGKSAFEIAVEHGFVGTEAEWLKSLKGVDGKNGVNGKDGCDGRNGVDGLPGKDGKDGADGVPGHNGADGKNGVDGINGSDGKSILLP